MLELAKREGAGPVAISDIAREQNIPTRFLEAILRQLKQAGFTDSARGKEGGYFLCKRARGITVGEVVHLFEGPLIAPAPAASEAQTPDRADVFSRLWTESEAAFSAVLNAVSFAELARRDRELATRYVANYTI
jgi:Rrf2 family protein